MASEALMGHEMNVEVDHAFYTLVDGEVSLYVKVPTDAMMKALREVSTAIVIRVLLPPALRGEVDSFRAWLRSAGDQAESEEG